MVAPSVVAQGHSGVVQTGGTSYAKCAVSNRLKYNQAPEFIILVLGERETQDETVTELDLSENNKYT